MAFSTAGGRPFQAEINVTPMIDVLLVLIIVFMVVVSMSKEKGLDAQIPQPAKDTSPEITRTICHRDRLGRREDRTARQS